MDQQAWRPPSSFRRAVSRRWRGEAVIGVEAPECGAIFVHVREPHWIAHWLRTGGRYVEQHYQWIIGILIGVAGLMLALG